MKKHAIDWESIEREYRVGQLSIKEIGRRFGITHSAIVKRAKKDGWLRNLSGAVKTEIQNRLLTGDAPLQSEKEIVDVAAKRGVELIREHRRDIGNGRALVTTLFQELKTASQDIEQLESAIQDETKGDKNSQRRSQMLRAVSLPSRAGTIRDLSMALSRLIPLERQAFNLDEGPVEGDVKVISDKPLSDEEWDAKYSQPPRS